MVRWDSLFVSLVTFALCCLAIYIGYISLEQETFVGPELPTYLTFRLIDVEDLDATLNSYAKQGYRVVSAAGGIGGPVIILEKKEK